MKVIIAGTRTFNDYELLKQKCDNILQGKEDIEIISGGAKGADSLGERYAKEKGFDLVIFHANWKKYGKSAGPKRNSRMAEYATHLIIFWEGKSNGSKNMIYEADLKGLPTRIINYNK